MIKCFAYFKSNILDIPSSCFHSPMATKENVTTLRQIAQSTRFILHKKLLTQCPNCINRLVVANKVPYIINLFFLMLIISFEKKRVNKAIKAHHKVWKYSFVSQSRYRNWIAWLQMSIVLINDNRQVSLGLNAWYFTMKHK